jgi:hypothetical protein
VLHQHFEWCQGHQLISSTANGSLFDLYPLLYIRWSLPVFLEASSVVPPAAPCHVPHTPKVLSAFCDSVSFLKMPSLWGGKVSSLSSSLVVAVGWSGLWFLFHCFHYLKNRAYLQALCPHRLKSHHGLSGSSGSYLTGQNLTEGPRENRCNPLKNYFGDT